MPTGKRRYITNLIICGLLPTTWLLSRLSRKEIILIFGMYVALLPFYLLWDSQATLHEKTKRTWVWEFNSKTLLGPKLFGVPVEEFVFMFLATALPISLWEFFISLHIPPPTQWTLGLTFLITAPIFHLYLAQKG